MYNGHIYVLLIGPFFAPYDDKKKPISTLYDEWGDAYVYLTQSQ